MTQINSAGEPASYLQDEYQQWATLYEAQPIIVQQFLQMQARQLADALLQKATHAHFMLPDWVVVDVSSAVEPRSGAAPIAAELREQTVGSLIDRLTASNIQVSLRNRLSELENSSDQALAVGAGLVRHATAVYMVQDMLPAGRSVTYFPADDEEIPTIPAGSELEPESAITAATDAIAEEGDDANGRGELLVPFVPAARRFFLPQWVAFGDDDQLLVNSVSEAEAYVDSMQRFMNVLHTAVSLASYIIADKIYQQKRYGMLGQLINQGRALARYQTRDIIHTIQRRGATKELNRGLSLSLPFFDDQILALDLHNFEVIPTGRIMFVPAFVVRATRLEKAKVGQDTRLNSSTKKHLLAELNMLEEAFLRL